MRPQQAFLVITSVILILSSLVGYALRAQDLEAVDYTPLPGDDWPVSTPAEQGLDSTWVGGLYANALELETLYGLLVVKNGHLIAEAYFHDGSVTQKARLQSVTKSVTSALVGIALDQGCLTSVDQKMLDFFPELADQISDPRKEQITIRNMLQMRAGYPWEESTPELFEMLYHGFRPSLLVTIPLVSDPGTQFEYSNLTSHLLGVIVARACDTDLKSFAQEHLFAPLDVEVGDWIQDWEGYYNGHADLHLTARDAAKFGLLYLNEGVYEGKQVVPASWVKVSLQRYSEDINTAGVRSGSVGHYFRDIGYGYQWWSARVGDHDFDFAWGHGGQLIVVLDTFDVVIAVTSDPMFHRHDYEAWKHERANIDLVGTFIASLGQPTAPPLTRMLPSASLHEAAFQGDLDAIRQYIETGADLNEKAPEDGATPLIVAASFGRTDVAKALIDAGADVNQQNNEGATALHTAAFFCHPEIVEALLDIGADKSIRNNAGATALDSVSAPFDAVKGVYDYFGALFEPLGLELDYERIKRTRPQIAAMLR